MVQTFYFSAALRTHLQTDVNACMSIVGLFARFDYLLVRSQSSVAAAALTVFGRMQQQQQQRPFTVLVEGNIGSGKSELLAHLQRQWSDWVVCLPEPVHRWRSVGPRCDNLLHLMYQEPRRWTLAFQSYVHLTMLQQHQLSPRVPVKLMERSIFSARHVFCENHARAGNLTAMELAILDAWYQQIAATCCADVVLYLDTPVELCLQRLQQRGRAEEKQAVGLQLLSSLAELYEEWMKGYSAASHQPGSSPMLLPVGTQVLRLASDGVSGADMRAMHVRAETLLLQCFDQQAVASS